VTFDDSRIAPDELAHIFDLFVQSEHTAFFWAGAFAWMGTGCVLNARRCARLHCFISGPVLWLGVIAAALVGIGIVSAPHALEDVVDATVILAALSWLPECLLSRHASVSGPLSAPCCENRTGAATPRPAVADTGDRAASLLQLLPRARSGDREGTPSLQRNVNKFNSVQNTNHAPLPL